MQGRVPDLHLVYGVTCLVRERQASRGSSRADARYSAHQHTPPNTMLKTTTLTMMACTALLLGCAHEPASKAQDAPVNQDYNLGLQAEARGDFAAARDAFWRASTKARRDGAAPAYQSAVLYNWGRMAGHTCHWAQSERLLQEALDIEVSVSGPDSGAISNRLFELARLHGDQGHATQAATHYERAVAMARRLGVGKSDPIGLANAYDDWAQALRGAGQPQQAAAAHAQGQTLRTQHPGQKARFIPRHYPKSCPR